MRLSSLLRSANEFKAWTVDELRHLPVGTVLVTNKRNTPHDGLIKTEPDKWRGYDVKKKQPQTWLEPYITRYVERWTRDYPAKKL